MGAFLFIWQSISGQNVTEVTSSTAEPITRDEIDRREAARREDDRHRHRMIIALAGLLIVALTALVSVTVSWATTTNALANKVDRVEQLKIDAGFDARINVNAQKIDGVATALARLQSSVDSANVRLRQMACNGLPASCR